MSSANKIRPTLIRSSYARLSIDAKNPRLPENIYDSKDQNKIWEHMKNAYDLDELALSISQNGYFEGEPLVAIPQEKEFSNEKTEAYSAYINDSTSKYIIVEGNRRLATIQGLMNGKLQYKITDSIKQGLENLPVLIYPRREEVLSFLGVHHLAGVRKWEVYQRARYIARLIEERNQSIKYIQQTIGDRRNSVKKIYVCYRLIEIIREHDETFNVKDAKANFSFLQLATGQGPIRKYIGLPAWQDVENVRDPIPKENYEKLKFLFECLFDSNDRKRLIRESREITSKLSKILSDADATKELENSRDIEQAFDFIGGEIIALNKYSQYARRRLETISGKLSGIDKSKLETPDGQKFIENISIISRLIDAIKKYI